MNVWRLLNPDVDRHVRWHGGGEASHVGQEPFALLVRQPEWRDIHHGHVGEHVQHRESGLVRMGDCRSVIDRTAGELREINWTEDLRDPQHDVRLSIRSRHRDASMELR